MKKLFLLFVLMSQVFMTWGQQSVTINIDMSLVDDFDPATRQLDIAGNFNGWALEAMSKVNDDLYTITLNDVQPGYYLGDIYQNDLGNTAWGDHGEWSGGPTGVDIMIYVGDEDVTIDTKWGETHNFTVDVDMNAVDGFDASTQKVFFLSDDVKMHTTEMLDEDADGVYTATFTEIPAGHFPVIFGFGADADNLTQEWVYATDKGNRLINLNAENLEHSFVYGESEVTEEPETPTNPSLTINVDMSGVEGFDATTRQIDFAGEITGWGLQAMTSIEENIYSITFENVTPGYYLGDAYHNDLGNTGWGDHGEWSGGPTGIDIMAYVGKEDVTVTTKWGETYDFVASVNMNDVEGFTAGTDNVYFLSNGVGALHNTLMEDANEDGIYTVTFNGVPSGHFPVIFGYGADTDNLTAAEWEYDTNKGDRVVNISGESVDLYYVYGNNKVQEKPDTEPEPEPEPEEPVEEETQPVAVTINVDMSGVDDFDAATRQIDWAGAFDGWASFYTLEMTSENIYSVTFENVEPGFYGGDVYHNNINEPAWGTYGEWSGGPTGVDIMVFVEGTEDVVVNTKWGETYNLTVDVDMNNVEEFVVGEDSVFLLSNEVGKLHLGSMLDENADGVYTIVYNDLPSGNFPVLFAYGEDRENLVAEWNYDENKGNRVITLENADLSVSYEFSTDGNTDPGTDPEPEEPIGERIVTINVDMSALEGFDPETMQIDWAGSFDGWSSFSTLEKTSDSNYSVTFENIASGYYIGDLYLNNLGESAWGTHGEWSGGPTGIDIMIYVGEKDVTINTVWGETYTLTVDLDMSKVSGFSAETDSVFLLSNGIAIHQTPMLDEDGDGIYHVVIEGVPSGTYPTVFGYGTDKENLETEWDFDQFMGDRVINVNAKDTYVSYVYEFGTDIPLSLENELLQNRIKVYPNPSSDGLVNVEVINVKGSVALKIYNLQGRLIQQETINAGYLKLSNLLEKGVYIIKLVDGEKSYNSKLIVN